MLVFKELFLSMYLNFTKLKMAFTVLFISAFVLFYSKVLIPIFLYSPLINSIILFCFLCGLILPFFYVVKLGRDLNFLNEYFENNDITNLNYRDIFSNFIFTNSGEIKKFFTLEESQVFISSIERKLQDRHSLTKYLIGILVLLGLLGTFFGLIQTISAISKSIGCLSSTNFSHDAFQQLIESIRSPLSSMGIAFSSSIFGLCGSLVLGFLDLQQGKSEKRFFDFLEQNLFIRTKGQNLQNSSNGPAYILALLEQTVEVMNELNAKIAQTEDNRINFVNVINNLNGILHGISNKDQNNIETLKTAILSLNEILNKSSNNIVNSVKELSSEIVSLKNIQISSLEENINSMENMTKDLKGEIRMVVKTLSILAGSDEEESISA